MSPHDAQKSDADEASFESLFQAHNEKLAAFARSRSTPGLGARRDGEDILQNAALKAQERFADFKRSGMAFYPWFCRVLLDCLFDDHDYQSRRRRDYRAEVAWPDRSTGEVRLGLAAQGTTPSVHLYRQELSQRIDQVLAELSPDHQEIVVLIHFAELNRAQAADILGIPSGTARQRYARARAEFRGAWKRLFGEQELLS